jgi:hypothetical protein
MEAERGRGIHAVGAAWHRRSQASRAGSGGMWVAARERRRPPLGPVLLCQPCGGHPLVVRKSSVSYPSVLCERLVRRAERGVRSGARVPSLTRVAGHAQRCGRYGASRGDQVQGGTRGRRARTEVWRLSCIGCRESGAMFRHARVATAPLRAGKSLALGGQRGGERGGPAGGAGAVSARPSGGRGPAGRSRRTHHAAPTRPPVCVCGSRTRPTMGGVSCRIRRRSRATSCQEWAKGVCG